MLLRAGLIYVLAVASLLLGTLAVWQGMQLSALKSDLTTLADHSQSTHQRLEETRLKAEAAERRALVAEDKLTRTGGSGVGPDSSAAEATPSDENFEKLKRELADAERERDAARVEAHQLAGELESAHKGAAPSTPGGAADASQEQDEAKAQIKKLSDELDAARRSLIEAKSAAGDREAAHQDVAKLTSELESARAALAQAQAATQERDAAREQVSKLSADLETAHKAIDESKNVAQERDAARAGMQKMSGELEAARKSLAEAEHAVAERDAARAEVQKLSGELAAANKTLEQAHQAARNLKDALAGVAIPSTDAKRSLAVTAAPVVPKKAAAPAASPKPAAPAASPKPAAQAVSLDQEASEQAGSEQPVKAPVAAGPPPEPKQKEFKPKHPETKGRQLDSSIFLPF